MTRLRQFRFWLIAGLLAASSLRCGGDNVQPTAPTDIEKVDGDTQFGTVGLKLPRPLVVLVTDASSNPVPGVDVHWVAVGGGSVSSEVVRTGSNGRASVDRTLGPNLGGQTTSASAAGLQGSPLTFVSTAVEPGDPASIAITVVPPVSALSTEVFDPAAQPVVEVEDASGAPLGGVAVTAALTGAGGTLEGTTTATTDGGGVARFGDLGIRGSGSQTIAFAAGAVSVSSSPVEVSPLPVEATMGKWGPVIDWDIVPLHMSLLPNGKIFAWGKRDAGTAVTDSMGMPRIWDPSSGPPSSAAEIHVSDMLFCAGHTLLPDGRLMVSGGHHMADAGIKATYFFSQDGAPTKGPDMMFGRWYPTLTVLPEGNVLTMAGRNEAGTTVTTPELWTGGSWTQLTGAGTLRVPYYPRNFVDPVRAGQVFYAGEQVMSRWFNYGGSGSWTTSGPRHIWGFNREYGTAVMYDTGKILYAGGGGDDGWKCECPAAERSSTPTATAEKIDLTQANPQWQNAGSMSARRRHLNSTVLPDGQVLITGGTRGGGFVDINEADAVKTAELWNPKIGPNGQWTTLAGASKMRIYHSVSLLLPDGTVLSGASGDAMAGTQEVPPERNHEIFSPPYLFKGARPTITSAPPIVTWKQTFSVATPNAAQITDVRWIRLGSVTHAFDAGQRANTLIFTQTATGVDVTAPPDSRSAPPGYYQLFILNRNGVPSVGSVVKIQ